ncbi:MAG: phospho-sugar mutase [Oscillospiraceae bacterium]|jgi:phosphoglucomutase|nr:phospho-sugar mutase [Oscillospiraceae bacterium]
MNAKYALWQNRISFAPDLQSLTQMTPQEIADAFSGNLAFGTGGLRGIMGLGTNRMNRYTVERVTHGLAKVVLLREFPKSVGIAYDTRRNSAEFAQTVGSILSAYGIAVYTFDKPMPTPALSFTIRRLGLGWGVVITASHNPKEYNGYKVYNSNGVQLTDKMADEVTEAIESVEFFEPLPEGRPGAVTVIGTDIEAAYCGEIVAFAQSEREPAEFSLVYSALHGTGANTIPQVLKQLGFSPICIQQNSDCDFGGLKTPNPEEPIVYAKAIEEAEKHGADMLLATDPDCDRVGVMAKTKEGYEPLSGNQIGALLIDYLAQTRGVAIGDTVITTIVSGLLGELVSESYGLEFIRLLTGFKYIGEYAEQLPNNKRFFFGYEESYGFLAGDGARDKDAVIASALIAQMGAFHHQKGKTLTGRWHELSQKHGYCVESLQSATLPPDRQKGIMSTLRGGISFEGMVKTEDYSKGINGLPSSDVLKLYFNDGSWAAIRPSGTEPKIKLYAGVREKTHDFAKRSLEALTNKILAGMGVTL